MPKHSVAYVEKTLFLGQRGVDKAFTIIDLIFPPMSPPKGNVSEKGIETASENKTQTVSDIKMETVSDINMGSAADINMETANDMNMISSQSNIFFSFLFFN